MAGDTAMAMRTGGWVDEMKEPAQERSDVMPADGCAFLH